MSQRVLSRAFFVIVLSISQGYGEASALAQCPPEVDPGPTPERTQILETDAYFLSADSASGAAGDAVGITVMLNSRVVNPGWINMQMTLCHDPDVAEILGAPLYTTEFLSLLGSSGSQFYEVNEDPSLPGSHRGHGFILNIGFEKDAYNARFPSDLPLAMMTVFYRLKGEAGGASQLEFCDGALELWASLCNYNFLHTYTWETPRGWNYLSTANSGGTLRVLDGPPTHPDRPPQPPEAKIYPDLPSDASVNFRVRVEGATALPGAREVPVEVYVSADVEYVAISVPVDFDERYLRLARAEDYFLTGVTLIDNRDEAPGAAPEEGNVVLFSGLGVNSYRLAAEGEELHAATLYFDVLEEAQAVGETSVTVEPVTDARGFTFGPWIGVRHKNGLNTGEVVVESQVEPVEVVGGRIALRPDNPLFTRGDCNGEGREDVTDAIFILNFNFLGALEPPCLAACDANGDGRVTGEITDALYMLNYSFLEGPPPVSPFPDCGRGEMPADRNLGCKSAARNCQ